MNVSLRGSSYWSDLVGVFFSALCIVHCVLPPLLLSIGGIGAFGLLIAAEWVHGVLLIVTVLFAVLSFPSGWSRHGHAYPVYCAAFGLLLLSLALVVDEKLETVLSVSGAIILVMAHLRNRSLLTKLKTRHCSGHS